VIFHFDYAVMFYATACFMAVTTLVYAIWETRRRSRPEPAPSRAGS